MKLIAGHQNVHRYDLNLALQIEKVNYYQKKSSLAGFKAVQLLLVEIYSSKLVLYSV